MKYAMMIGLGLMTLATTELSAGVLGKYKVKGMESGYSFHGTLNLSSYTGGTVSLNYNDGDSIVAKGKFKTPLKNTMKKQTVKCTWSAAGMTGTGTVTVSGSGSGYKSTFTYSGFGVSGRGTGTKKP